MLRFPARGGHMIEYKTTYQISEAHFRLAMEAARVGMWYRDFVPDQPSPPVWDDICKALFGLSPETEVSYKLFLSLVHPDDRARVEQAIDASQRNLTEFHAEHRIIWPDGSLHWVAAWGRSTLEREGQFVHMMGVISDITAQKQAEKVQLEETRKAKNILESVTEAFGHSDREWRITYINS